MGPCFRFPAYPIGWMSQFSSEDWQSQPDTEPA